MFGSLGLGLRLGVPAFAVAGVADADAQAIIDEMVVAPDATRQSLINDLVVDLKAAGVWAKTDVLFVLAAHTEQAALLNWKNPSVTPATNVNAVTFALDAGFTGDGSTSYLDTNYNPSTFAGQYTLNSAHIAIRVQTNVAVNGADIGARLNSTDDVTQLNPRAGTDNAFYALNSTAAASVPSTDSTGYWVLRRPDSTQISLFRNAVLFENIASASDAIFNGNIFVCAVNENASPTSFSTRQIAIAHAGSSLTDTEIADADTAFDAYIAGL